MNSNLQYHKNKARLPCTTKKRHDQSDYDYLGQLSNTEFEWMLGFHYEYVNASKNHKWPKHHRTQEQFREIYNRNNANNRCMYSIAKVLGLLNFGDDFPEYDPRFAPELTEDYMICLVDGINE